MSFYKTNNNGENIRIKTQLDCSGDEVLTEQSHKDEVNINNIVARHGIDLIQKTAMLNQGEYLMDDNPNNDFQESMNIVTKAQQQFEQMPSALRKKFNNNPAEFMDYVQNPQNYDGLVEMGLAQRRPEPPKPVQVEIINQVSETPQDKPPT